MKNKTWTERMHDIHGLAKEKGWWGEDEVTARPEYEIDALIISEWSEALEEARAGRPMIWHKCSEVLTESNICENNRNCYCKTVLNSVTDCEAYMVKPEGIAVELVDGIIRILDWLGWCEEVGMLKHSIDNEIKDCAHRLDLEEYRAMDTANIVFILCQDIVVQNYVGAIANAATWLICHDVDVENVMRIKHYYNRSRPPKHGKLF